MRAIVLLTAAALLLSGCIGGPNEGTNAADADGSGSDGELPTGLPTEADLAMRTLTAPPTWYVGEWWDVAVHSELGGTTYEATVVVAGAEDGRYLVGQPLDEFEHGLLIQHLPFLGEVGREDHAFDVHDEDLQPIQFPALPGTEWESTWLGSQPVQAEITSADEEAGMATFEIIGQNVVMEGTYDAALGAVSELVVEGYGSYEVTDHGFGYAGEVLVPRGIDLIFLNGRIAGGASPSLEPAAPVETITVPDGYDQASIAFLLGDLLDTGSPGQYEVTADAPNGETYQGQHTGLGSVVQLHEVAEPSGDWELQYVAAGPGAAVIEGVAYTVDVRTLG